MMISHATFVQFLPRFIFLINLTSLFLSFKIQNWSFFKNFIPLKLYKKNHPKDKPAQIPHEWHSWLQFSIIIGWNLTSFNKNNFAHSHKYLLNFHSHVDHYNYTQHLEVIKIRKKIICYCSKFFSWLQHEVKFKLVDEDLKLDMKGFLD